MTTNPFIEANSVSVIGAITISEVLAVMTLNDSMDTFAFKVCVSKCLVPQLWKGAVVVMDNLPAHKVKAMRAGSKASQSSKTTICAYALPFN